MEPQANTTPTQTPEPVIAPATEPTPSSAPKKSKKGLILGISLAVIGLLAATAGIGVGLKNNADSAAKAYISDVSSYLKKAYGDDNAIYDFVPLIKKDAPVLKSVPLGSTLSDKYKRAESLESTFTTARNAVLKPAESFSSTITLFRGIEAYAKSLQYRVSFDKKAILDENKTSNIPVAKEQLKTFDEKIKLLEGAKALLSSPTPPESYAADVKSLIKNVDLMTNAYKTIREQNDIAIQLAEALQQDDIEKAMELRTEIVKGNAKTALANLDHAKGIEGANTDIDNILARARADDLINAARTKYQEVGPKLKEVRTQFDDELATY